MNLRAIILCSFTENFDCPVRDITVDILIRGYLLIREISSTVHFVGIFAVKIFDSCIFVPWKVRGILCFVHSTVYFVDGAFCGFFVETCVRFVEHIVWPARWKFVGRFVFRFVREIVCGGNICALVRLTFKRTSVRKKSQNYYYWIKCK